VYHRRKKKKRPVPAGKSEEAHLLERKNQKDDEKGGDTHPVFGKERGKLCNSREKDSAERVPGTQSLRRRPRKEEKEGRGPFEEKVGLSQDGGEPPAKKKTQFRVSGKRKSRLRKGGVVNAAGKKEYSPSSSQKKGTAPVRRKRLGRGQARGSK